MNNPEILAPGTGEALWFLDTLMPVKLPATTTPPLSADDVGRLAAIGAQHDVTIVGPPPAG